MFERFTDEARRAVVLAQEEARSFGHDYIGTEHLLLGILHEGRGPAAHALEALDVTADGVRGRVEQIIGRGPGATADHVPFTPRAKKVLELSLRESLQLGNDHIGTEHLLLGLIREGEGVAAVALEQQGVALERLRAEVAAHLPGEDPPARGRRWLRRERERQHGRHAGGPPPALGSSSLERFDDAAWEAMMVARRSARARSAPAVAVRDVLVGVATVPGPGANALAAAGLDAAALDMARDETAVGADADGDEAAGADDAVPAMPAFTAAVRERLRWAVDDADQRGHAAAGTGHLLLALLTVPDDELDELLSARGVRRGDVHAEAARVLAGDLGRPGGA